MTEMVTSGLMRGCWRRSDGPLEGDTRPKRGETAWPRTPCTPPRQRPTLVVIPASALQDVRGLIGAVRAGCEAAGRDPASLVIAVDVQVSIGRTSAEAHARASHDPRFHDIGHPATRGIFGTLEQCQDRAIELAHLGVTDLRCLLPNTPDVHDAIAQLTAVVVGTVDVLTPNSPRSKAPDPPEGWGGRPVRR